MESFDKKIGYTIRGVKEDPVKIFTSLFNVSFEQGKPRAVYNLNLSIIQRTEGFIFFQKNFTGIVGEKIHNLYRYLFPFEQVEMNLYSKKLDSECLMSVMDGYSQINLRDLNLTMYPTLIRMDKDNSSLYLSIKSKKMVIILVKSKSTDTLLSAFSAMEIKATRIENGPKLGKNYFLNLKELNQNYKKNLKITQHETGTSIVKKTKLLTQSVFIQKNELLFSLSYKIKSKKL